MNGLETARREKEQSRVKVSLKVRGWAETEAPKVEDNAESEAHIQSRNPQSNPSVPRGGGKGCSALDPQRLMFMDYS